MRWLLNLPVVVSQADRSAGCPTHCLAGCPAHPLAWFQVALEVDDRGKQRLILRVTADFVRVQASRGVGSVAMLSCLGQRQRWVVWRQKCGRADRRAGGHRYPSFSAQPFLPLGSPLSATQLTPSCHPTLTPLNLCALPCSPQVKSAINSSHNHEELLELLRGALGALWSRRVARLRLGQMANAAAPTRHTSLALGRRWQMRRPPCAARSQRTCAPSWLLHRSPGPATNRSPVLSVAARSAGVRLGQLSLQRGEDQRHKILIVDGLDPGKLKYTF